jgi:hypothetical protein
MTLASLRSSSGEIKDQILAGDCRRAIDRLDCQVTSSSSGLQSSARGGFGPGTMVRRFRADNAAVHVVAFPDALRHAETL